MGCRFSPTFCHGDPNKFAKNATILSVNNDKNELKLNSKNIDISIKSDLKNYVKKFFDYFVNKKIKSYSFWNEYCLNIKNNNLIKTNNLKKNPIDLYKFMFDIGEYTKKKHTLITDAGSNYYAGGQVWYFKKNQNEISSTTNAAMGLSIPLSIGAAIGNKNKQIVSITGDGSIELNIQELKTISHYKLNIKTFVINNGGYVSMQKWQDDFFSGNRLDTKKITGVGTLNFKNVAKAFNLKYLKIRDYRQIRSKLKKIFSNNQPMLIEVITDQNQKIYGKEF